MKTKHKIIRQVSLIIFICMLFVAVSATLAQTTTDFLFKIMQVRDQEFPKVEVFTAVVDNQGHLVEDFTEANFSLQEDGKNIPGFTLSTGINSQQPLTIALVVDVGQTDDDDFKLGLEAAAKYIEELIDGDLVGVITFSDEVKLAKKIDSEKNEIIPILQETERGGELNLYDGLKFAVDLIVEEAEENKDENPKAIVLFSNGLDSGSSQALPEDIIEAAAAARIQIYPFGFEGFGGPVYPTRLNPLAENTGGKTIYLPGKDDIEDELEEAFSNLKLILDEVLRYQYILKYDSLSSSNGEKRLVKATVNHLGWKGEDTDDFIACPGILKVCLPDFDPPNTVADNTCLEPILHTPNPPIQKLTVAVNGKAFCSDSVSPFECCLDTKAIDEGKHSFKFVALDEVDRSGELNTSLYVRPTVKFEITVPEEGADIYTNKLKVISKLNSLNALEKVEIIIDKKILYEDTPAVPAQGPPYIYNYELELDVSTISGKKSLIITTLDSLGNTSKSEINLNFAAEPPQGIGWLGFAAIALIILAVIILLIAVSRRRASGGDGITLAEGNASLFELEGHYPNQVWPLEAAQIRLGRKSRDNDIPLKGVGASRYMAEIRFHDGQYYIYSLKPENPVIVNNNPVYQQKLLEPGDSIRLGESLFRYDINE